MVSPDQHLQVLSVTGARLFHAALRFDLVPTDRHFGALVEHQAHHDDVVHFDATCPNAETGPTTSLTAVSVAGAFDIVAGDVVGREACPFCDGALCQTVPELIDHPTELNWLARAGAAIDGLTEHLDAPSSPNSAPTPWAGEAAVLRAEHRQLAGSLAEHPLPKMVHAMQQQRNELEALLDECRTKGGRRPQPTETRVWAFVRMFEADRDSHLPEGYAHLCKGIAAGRATLHPPIDVPSLAGRRLVVSLETGRFVAGLAAVTVGDRGWSYDQVAAAMRHYEDTATPMGDWISAFSAAATDPGDQQPMGA